MMSAPKAVPLISFHPILAFLYLFCYTAQNKNCHASIQHRVIQAGSFFTGKGHTENALLERFFTRTFRKAWPKRFGPYRAFRALEINMRVTRPDQRKRGQHDP